MSALAGVTVDDLVLVGSGTRAQLVEAITAAELVLSLDQAPTLNLTVHDPHRVLLTSGLASSRAIAALDGVLFELVRVAKSGSSLTLTFEDAAVADLRKRTEHRKVAPNTITRTDFARQLVAEAGWIAFEGPPTPLAKVEMARGKPDAGDDQPPQDTWSALYEAIARPIGWRRYARANVVVFTSDQALLDAGPVATLAEHRDGVDTIDYDYDVGLRVATATVAARAGRWDLPQGACVEVAGQGPADGRWIVSEVRRTLSAVATTVSLIQPSPTLPEPEPEPEPAVPAGTADSYVEQGPSAPLGVTSGAGFAWPSGGRVSSPFGAPRDGGARKHEGIDIAAAKGTAIVAVMDGTVVRAASSDSYGLVVYVDHEGGVQTRYAHMSRMVVRAGQKVSAGAKLGEVGDTGNAKGNPHNHFEVRRHGVAVDPLTVLPKR